MNLAMKKNYLQLYFPKFILLLLFLSSLNTFAQTVRYVKEGGTGNGSSWANASGDLQLMINNSSSGDQVWVAEGTYLPRRKNGEISLNSNPNDKLNTFVLRNEVELYGCFKGNETSVTQRNIDANPTILSGDFNNDDANVAATNLYNTSLAKNADNAYHIVLGVALNTFTVFDGFIIKGGNAVSITSYYIGSEGFSNYRGSGIYLRKASPQVKNIKILNCYSVSKGGGIFVTDSGTPQFSNITINTCFAGTGGAINAMDSGVIATFKNLLVNNCYSNQGTLATTDSGSLIVINATLTQNSTLNHGAALYLEGGSISVQNSIVSSNGSKDPVAAVSGGTATFINSLVQGSGGNQAWNANYGTNNGGNIDADPLFTSAASGDFTLQPGSPAINAGNNSFVASLPIDIAGNPRIHGGTVDMGAYEFGSSFCTTPLAPAAANQVLCTTTNPTIASLTADGTNLKWYTAEAGGTVLEADEEVIAGTYYVSQSNGTCESVRTAVEVTLADNCITLEEAFCNITATFSKPLYAAYVPGATKYRFRVNDGNDVQVIERTGRYFYVNNINGFNYGKHYSVSVSYLKDGQWSAYGPACSVSTPVLAVSQLKPEYCGIAVSSFTTAIYASSAPMTTGYRFRIVEGGNTQVLEKTVGYFKINEITGYTYGKTYTVDVAIKINGEWGAYGPDCTVTISEAVAQLADAYCGITTPNLKTVIYAKGLPQAASYRFRINDSNTDYILTRTQRYFLVSQIPGYTYDTVYTINVAALINGNWTDYGPACTITTPVAPLTQMVAAQCGSTVTSLASNIKINPVSRAQGYRLLVTNGVQEQILDRPTASFRLNMLASREYNVTYNVEVAVLVNGVYGPYGPVCTIMAVSGTSRPGSYDLTTEAEMDNDAQATTLTSYPNPFIENFSIELNTQSLDKVTVRAFDMNGRLVEDITISPQELSSKKLGAYLAAGIYNVMVSQGKYLKTFKVVKK